eukprot:TRINITY_DN1697_c0_g3_i2.p2 TRINITY_DN1697_c0_g3~~TRINITY_DN1697_c0_g3_i2.p2  ORF type:complete len:269 (-),score=113.37 TRINITY_DN1697_c0_g3_i2:664-1470(-)
MAEPCVLDASSLLETARRQPLQQLPERLVAQLGGNASSGVLRCTDVLLLIDAIRQQQANRSLPVQPAAAAAHRGPADQQHETDGGLGASGNETGVWAAEVQRLQSELDALQAAHARLRHRQRTDDERSRQQIGRLQHDYDAVHTELNRLRDLPPMAPSTAVARRLSLSALADRPDPEDLAPAGTPRPSLLDSAQHKMQMQLVALQVELAEVGNERSVLQQAVLDAEARLAAVTHEASLHSQQLAAQARPLSTCVSVCVCLFVRMAVCA